MFHPQLWHGWQGTVVYLAGDEAVLVCQSHHLVTDLVIIRVLPRRQHDVATISNLYGKHSGSVHSHWKTIVDLQLITSLLAHICLGAKKGPQHSHMSRQFRPSVCLSVTCVYCIKTAKRIIEILSPSDRPIILVFRHQGSSRKSDGFTPNGGAKYKGGSNFWPKCGYISETVIDKDIVTMEDEYKVVCALSNGATFDELEWHRTPVSSSKKV